MKKICYVTSTFLRLLSKDGEIVESNTKEEEEEDCDQVAVYPDYICGGKHFDFLAGSEAIASMRAYNFPHHPIHGIFMSFSKYNYL